MRRILYAANVKHSARDRKNHKARVYITPKKRAYSSR
jgi:hypothetical protein